MDSIVSRIILPGVGPVCPECLSRGHLPALRLSPREVYSFGLAEHQRQLDWDVDAARARFASKVEREAAFDALVSDLGWRTAEMLKVYDHAITRAEMKEQTARSVHDWVDSAPSDRASLDALLRRSLANMTQEAAETQSAAAFVLTDTAREGLAWLEELGHL